ncbi:MAG: nucleotidyltransferase domain-containing protein [Anaerolineae bacterium]
MLDLSSYQGVVMGAISHPLLFTSVSGAHLYGFPSPDSDVDLRGCHVLPARALLGLHPPKPTFNRTWTVDGVEIDLVSHDLVKFVVLLLQPHGNYLEQLFSPLVALDTPWAEELRSLARQGAISRRAYQPYAGYARSQWLAWRKLAVAGPAPLKPLLYAYRVSLTGVHLLRTGRINANLAELAPEYGYGYLLDLIAAKTSEHAALALPVEMHDAALERLQEELAAARDASPLLAEPANQAALDDFVVRVRLAEEA